MIFDTWFNEFKHIQSDEYFGQNFRYICSIAFHHQKQNKQQTETKN